MYTYRHPRPMVTVDLVLLKSTDRGIKVLLIQRGQAPFKDHFALPGGFVEMDETLEAAAARELAEETGLKEIPLEQIHTFSDPNRDPRGRVISTAFGVVLDDAADGQLQAGSDAAAAAWFLVKDLPELAFDHKKIIAHVINHFNSPGEQ